jgi:hypothetical protein
VKVIAVRMMADFSRHQLRNGKSAGDLHGHPLEDACEANGNVFCSCRSIQGSSNIGGSPFKFSQSNFNCSATAIMQVLQTKRNVSNAEWSLYHWEVRVTNHSNVLYLHHPTIDVFMPAAVVNKEHGLIDSEEYNLEDENVIMNDYTSSWVNNSRTPLTNTQWTFSIVYSDTYGVPILYFHVQDIHGAPCSRPQVLEMLLYWAGKESLAIDDPWDFISQEQHPFTNMPTFFLHPCQSTVRLELLMKCNYDVAKGSLPNNLNVLWSWMSMMLPTVGHPIPSALFLEVQDQLKRNSHL